MNIKADQLTCTTPKSSYRLLAQSLLTVVEGTTVDYYFYTYTKIEFFGSLVLFSNET
jgi:hypothetical protein